MKIKKIAAIYSLVMGSGIILAWLYLLFNNLVPELEINPIELYMHLTAEFITAIFLFISGILMYEHIKGGVFLYLTSMGMLFYTLIQTPGYFLSIGQKVPAILFFIFLGTGLSIYIVILVKEIKFSNP